MIPHLKVVLVLIALVLSVIIGLSLKWKGEINMTSFEIFFKDLKKEAQIRLMETFNTSAKDENWDIFPIAVIDREDSENNNDSEN